MSGKNHGIRGKENESDLLYLHEYYCPIKESDNEAQRELKVFSDVVSLSKQEHTPRGKFI